MFTKDPHTGGRNVGMYRLQKRDAVSTGLHWQVHKDAAADWRDGAGLFAGSAAGWSEQGLGGDGVAGAAGDGGGLGCGFGGRGFADLGLGCWMS